LSCITPYYASDRLRQQSRCNVKRRKNLNVLHVQGNPELIRDEGHVSEEDAEDAEVEVAVPPDAGVEEWMCVDILPDGKAEEGDEAENKHCDDFRGFPACCWPFSSSLLASEERRVKELTSRLLRRWPSQ
jgi:hypothetical protein